MHRAKGRVRAKGAGQGLRGLAKHPKHRVRHALHDAHPRREGERVQLCLCKTDTLAVREGHARAKMNGSYAAP